MLQGSRYEGRVVEMVRDNHEAGWKIIRMKGGVRTNNHLPLSTT